MTNTLVVVVALTAMTFFTSGMYFYARMSRQPAVRRGRDAPNSTSDLRSLVRLVRELLPLFIASNSGDRKACTCACQRSAKSEEKRCAGSGSANRRMR